MIQIPELFCKEGAFIACRFCKLHIGGKLAALQKLPDTLCGALPGNDLGRPVITDRLPVGKMDTILGILKNRKELRKQSIPNFGFSIPNLGMSKPRLGLDIPRLKRKFFRTSNNSVNRFLLYKYTLV